MDGPRLSVVIPYYNNGRTLLRCLESFANQQTLAPHEIVVVDDGSSSPAAPFLQSFVSKVPIRLIQGDHGGQSRASNIGIKAAEGELVLLSCADIIANEVFCEVHHREHVLARARGESVAVMGHIAYPLWMPQTPFLQYLSEDGPQFCFGGIKDPERVDGALLYSPNFSIERSWIRRLGGFDEQFPYGFQDTDFGIRLVQAGIRLIYRKESLAQHDHPNDLANFARRNIGVGRHFYRMMTRHESLFVREKMRYAMSVIGSMPQMLSELMAATKRFEAAFVRGKHLDPTRRAQLFELYEQVTSIAFFEGAIQGDERLGALMGFHPDTWRAIRAREPATHNAYRHSAIAS